MRRDNDSWITIGIYVVWVATFIVGVTGTLVLIHFIRKFW